MACAEAGRAALVGDLGGEGGGFGDQGGEVGLVVGLAAREHLQLLAGALPAAQRQSDLLELGGGDHREGPRGRLGVFCALGWFFVRVFRGCLWGQASWLFGQLTFRCLLGQIRCL